MHFPVLSGTDTVLLFEGPEEGGIIGESYGLSHCFHGMSLFNQQLCSNESALGKTAIKTNTHFLAESLGDGTFTHEEVMGNIRQSQMF